jgi:hypothetical protein
MNPNCPDVGKAFSVSRFGLRGNEGFASLNGETLQNGGAAKQTASAENEFKGNHPPEQGIPIYWSYAVLPASTVSTVPVMLPALSPSRNSTALATSSGTGSRCNALRRATLARWSSAIP